MNLIGHQGQCKAGSGNIQPRLQILRRTPQKWGRPPGGGLRILGTQAQPTIMFSIRFPRHLLKHMQPADPNKHPIVHENTHKSNHESVEESTHESEGIVQRSEGFACRYV